MIAEGKVVSMKTLCKWFQVARSTVYYRPIKRGTRFSKPLDQVLTEQVWKIIEANPTFGVRRITAMIRRELNRAVNRKAVHRILKTNGWQVRKKPSGFKERAKGMRSKSAAVNERWAIDATTIFCGEDGWCPLIGIIDCCDRYIVGWRLSTSGTSKNAAAALEDAIILRQGEINPSSLVIRSDNGLIFGAKPFIAVVREHGLAQEYITPYTPEQNGMIERFFRTIKEECIWQYRFKNRDEALHDNSSLDG